MFKFKTTSLTKQRTLTIALLMCVAASGCTTFEVTESYMFPSFGLGQTMPDGATLNQHRFIRPDGSEVYGMSVVLDPAQPSVLYFGGNNQSVDRSMSWVVSNFTAMNINVYFFDRRGQGRNRGTPGVETAYEDAKAVWKYVQSQVEGPLILHGLSLGAFEAAAVAATHHVDALVLEATSTNVEEFVEHAVPWYAKPIVRVEIDDELRGVDNRDHLKQYYGPLLLLGAEDDRSTAPELMEKLYQASPSALRRLSIIENANHYSAMSQTQARDIYRDFLVAADLLPGDGISDRRY